MLFFFNLNKTIKNPKPYEKALDQGESYYVFLKNESRIQGEFIRSDSMGRLIFRTDFSSLTISKTDIEKVVLVSVYTMRDNPHSYKYLYSPSAIGLKKGESYLQSTYGLITNYTYAFTDHFSVRGITTTIASVITRDEIGQSIMPIFSGYRLTNNLYYSAGAIFGYMPEYGHIEASFGMITYGSKNDNITLTGGFVNVKDFNYEGTLFRPFATLSVMMRASKNISIISENWSMSPTIEGLYPIGSLGIRFFGKHVSFDMAFVYNKKVSSEIFRFGGPYFDLAYKF